MSTLHFKNNLHDVYIYQPFHAFMFFNYYYYYYLIWRKKTCNLYTCTYNGRLDMVINEPQWLLWYIPSFHSKMQTIVDPPKCQLPLQHTHTHTYLEEVMSTMKFRMVNKTFPFPHIHLILKIVYIKWFKKFMKVLHWCA